MHFENGIVWVFIIIGNPRLTMVQYSHEWRQRSLISHWLSAIVVCVPENSHQHLCIEFYLFLNIICIKLNKLYD